MLSRRQFLAGTGTLLLSEQAASADDSASATPIYLTIDDGPTPYMKDIVDVLGDKGKATFFLVGRNLAENSSRMSGMDLARYALEHGHDLGNHSYSHPWFSYHSIEKAKEQIEKTRELIENVYAQCGRTAPLFFRFPFGDNGCTSRIKEGKKYYLGSQEHKRELADLLAGMGYSTYNWEVVDFPSNPRRIKPGAVVLTHDWPTKLGVNVSREYIHSGKFELLLLPRPAIPEYELRHITKDRII